MPTSTPTLAAATGCVRTPSAPSWVSTSSSTPYRLVFTWGWEDSSELPPGSSTVEITLVPDGDGTLIRLRHTGLPSEESRALHAAGWSHYLERLSLAAAGRDPGPDPLAAP
jgi:activator of Hsp90 ATPase-like protein